ncbi:hypothetical protein VCRA2110O318_40060 [Vibrio crassostreae]|nr:hypothetical protein VCRA2117O328_40059 [Vibrio crassostreae]CAK2335447.1 hypothetical protein VCRA2110O318_40060 [Vibrio crassostreae]CAK2503913.1 hypothetical protein VCRA2110O319_50060 [Vibrio crassostreae]CAK2909537.1 hypothetical protein VCRA217O317_30233 [Vibrio crassostreae]
MPKLIDTSPTATYTDKNTYFNEAARITSLPVEDTELAILRVIGQEGVRSKPDRMMENQFQRDIRSEDAADNTYRDILLTPDDGGQSYRLDVVDSQYIHDIAVARGYNPLALVSSLNVPTEIAPATATEVSTVVSGQDSILWTVSVGGDAFSSDEFADETALTTDLTITAASGTEVVVRLIATNSSGVEVAVADSVITV